MRCDPPPLKSSCARLLATALVAASFALTAAAFDETPRIPGAVVDCPAWLKSDAPFDVAKYFAQPAQGKNAAPLYLDAFAEFSPSVVICLPAAQKGRAELAQDRSKRLNALSENLGEKSASLDRKAADAMLAELHEGFRKLAGAQRRPQCMFAIGLSLDSVLPHVQAARDVVRALNLRVARDVEKGNLDRPIQDVAAGFRLSRDLQPRAPIIAQLVSVALDGVLCLQSTPTILGSTALKATQCDQLLDVLRQHETSHLDRLTAGAMGEYVMQRTVIHAFEDKRVVKGGENGRAVETAITKADLAKMMFQLVQAYHLENVLAPTQDEANALLGRHEASWAKERAVIAEFYQTLTAPEPKGYTERVRKLDALIKARMTGPAAETFWIGRLIIPDYKIMILVWARAEVYVHASECLVAIRRWQLTHAGVDPTNLAAACKEAKLPGVPIDPFSGVPLKLAVIDGRPVVYSIGPDGVDDRGLKDSNLGRKPEGDMLFRLPAATK